MINYKAVMKDMTLYPLTFAPIYRDYLWGGTKIAKRFQRSDVPQCCAESWEVSGHKEGVSVVEHGAWKGQTLADICAREGTAVLGDACESKQFPLLIKLIDAKERLSVQVHPNDESAERYGGEAKTEMWYVLDAEPGAKICAGLRKGVVGPRQFHDATVEKHVDRLLRVIPSEPGKSIYIPGGLVHAIGEGNLIFEVQQSSNTTYRVYDWDRVGPDGRPRDLHVRQAMEVIAWRAPEVEFLTPIPMKSSAPANRRIRFLRSDFFIVEAVMLKEAEAVTMDGLSFHVLFVEKGSVSLTWEGGAIELPLGKSCLVPAKLGKYTLTPTGAEAKVVVVTV